jgi:hypothetical protein
MADNPLNLALRFFLELAALVAMGYWGWTQHDGFARWLLAIGVPVVAAAAWGIFRVPGDPGDAPVPVPGLVRLTLEFAFFSGATWALFAAGRPSWGWAFGIVTLLHYAASYDRVARLVRQSERT